jgi:hypothetical protein
LANQTQIKMNLTAVKKDMLSDLVMTISLLRNETVNIHWTYSNNSGHSTPFEVPNDLVNVNRSDLME